MLDVSQPALCVVVLAISVCLSLHCVPVYRCFDFCVCVSLLCYGFVYLRKQMCTHVYGITLYELLISATALIEVL